MSAAAGRGGKEQPVSQAVAAAAAKSVLSCSHFSTGVLSHSLLLPDCLFFFLSAAAAAGNGIELAAAAVAVVSVREQA